MNKFALIVGIFGFTLGFNALADERKAEAKANAPVSAETPAPQKKESTYYTCPMHKDVVSSHPATCPKCGMNLEKGEGAKKQS